MIGIWLRVAQSKAYNKTVVKVNLKPERSKRERKKKKNEKNKQGKRKIEHVFKAPGGKTLPGGNGRESESPCLGLPGGCVGWCVGWCCGWGWWANPCNFDSNLVLALRTWAQWLMLARGHQSLSPSDIHLPVGEKTLWLPVVTVSARCTEQVAGTRCQGRHLCFWATAPF